MSGIVCGLSVAGGAAETWVIRTGLEKFVAEVGPGVGTVAERGVHGGGVEGLRRIVTVDGPAEFGGGVGV